MSGSAFNRRDRSSGQQAQAQDGLVSATSCSRQLPEHPCDALCAVRQGRTGAVCPQAGAASEDGTVGRSGFLRGVGAVVGGVALGGVAGPLGGLFSPAAGTLAAGTSRRAASGSGLWLGNARGLTPAQPLAYTDPGSGDQALLLRLANGQYVSFDAGCTHGTCTVAYDTGRRLMVCPCHGAIFDLAHGAAVLVGPAKDPLYQLPIRVDAAGDVYYLDAPPGPRIDRLRKAPPYTGQTGDDSGDSEGSSGHGGDGGNSQIRTPHRGAKARPTPATRDE